MVEVEMLLYAKRTCTVYSVVLNPDFLHLAHKFPVKLRPDLKLLPLCDADTTTAGVQMFLCFKCCVCGRESECNAQTKIIVLYRKRYLGFKC